MTDDNSNLVDMDDLDKFSNAFYEVEPEDGGEVEEVDETESDQLAPDGDKDADEGDETPDEDDVPEEEETPKKGKKSAKERIEELVAKTREQERREVALLQRLEQLEAKVSKPEEKPEPTLREQLADDAPNPDALDDKGEPVYPLGEFDPKFIRDITKYTIDQETKARKEVEAKEAHEARVAQERQELANSWNEKVEEFEKDHDDFREGVQSMVQTFAGVDQEYGDFLATSIMSLDNGPAVMYHLSQNIGEAQKIVASGPFAATLAIGRLAEKLAPKQEEKATQKKVSQAPEPAPAPTRGKGGQFSVRPDTDDLDAFSREFFS